MECENLKRPRMSPEPSSIAGEQSSVSHRLPQEIVLFEILPWLPLKAILRFRRVCRNWHLIISGGNRRLAIEQFQRQVHRQPSPSPATSIGLMYGCKGYLYQNYFGETLALFPIPPRFYINHMDASTNGLCCLVCVDSPRDKSTPFAYIYNPFMGKPGERVPLIYGEGFETFSSFLGPIGKTTRSLGLAFDPPASILDGVDYKLVQFDCICSDSSRYELRFFVYSSNTGRWVRSGSKASKAVDPSVSLRHFDRYSCPVFYAGRGKLYWHNPSFLVCYDVERDVADCMAMPELTPGGRVVHYDLERYIADCMAMPELQGEARYVQRQELMVLRGGRLLCTRLLRSDFLEVWALLDDKQWERRKEVSLYSIMEKGMHMKWFIRLKNCVVEKLLMAGDRVYEDEEDRGRLYLSFFFNCGIRLSGETRHFVGALNYDLEKDIVVRCRGIIDPTIKDPSPHSWPFKKCNPIFTVHHTMFVVPTRP